VVLRRRQHERRDYCIDLKIASLNLQKYLHDGPEASLPRKKARQKKATEEINSFRRLHCSQIRFITTPNYQAK
jgi:hypothetical protein